MPEGPGKYDDYCERALIGFRARAVVLFVLDGTRGSGFSVNATEPLESLPRILRTIADECERVQNGTAVTEMCPECPPIIARCNGCPRRGI
jgi:hypothetical protein